MLFKRRSKRSIPPPHRKPSESTSRASGLFPIEYGMMLKGSIAQRRGVPVRQFGVYVKGSIRLVTSGDHVDRETYEALLAEGAIEPPAGPADHTSEPLQEEAPRIIEDSAPETEY